MHPGLMARPTALCSALYEIDRLEARVADLAEALGAVESNRDTIVRSVKMLLASPLGSVEATRALLELEELVRVD